LQIAKENDLLSFEFTSKWTHVVSKYIIGIASAYSGDIDYSEKLLRDALELTSKQNKSFPIYKILQERIPVRISELYELKASVAHRKWVETHDTIYIKELGEYLSNVENNRKNLPSVLFLRAIYSFAKERNADEAINLLNKIKDRNNGTWHYNKAFLYCYKGDLKLAIRHYREAVFYSVEASVLNQVEDFMCWVLAEEPDKYQILYCLGFFNWKAKGDEIQAIKDFEAFLARGKSGKFEKERELAEQWLKDLKGTVDGRYTN